MEALGLEHEGTADGLEGCHTWVQLLMKGPVGCAGTYCCPLQMRLERAMLPLEVLPVE